MNRSQQIIQLCEGKQVGLLYHITDIYGLFGILNSDSFRKKRENGISFTRNKNFKGWNERFQIYITVDGEKLSHTYKIVPFHDQLMRKDLDEFEERIFVDKIPDATKYIKSIKVLAEIDEDEKTALGKLSIKYNIPIAIEGPVK